MKTIPISVGIAKKFTEAIKAEMNMFIDGMLKTLNKIVVVSK
jgi:hypothetical protein